MNRLDSYADLREITERALAESGFSRGGKGDGAETSYGQMAEVFPWKGKVVPTFCDVTRQMVAEALGRPFSANAAARVCRVPRQLRPRMRHIDHLPVLALSGELEAAPV